LFAILVPGPTTPGIEVITKLDVAHRHTSTTVPRHRWPLRLGLHK